MVPRRMTRSSVALAGMVTALLLAITFAAAAAASDSNQVDFWCDTGIKIDPVNSASFTVPAPPDGSSWTKLVLKSGLDNEVFSDPVPGRAYTPSNGKDVSHAILCSQVLPPPTTAATTTTGATTSTTGATTSTTGATSQTSPPTTPPLPASTAAPTTSTPNGSTLAPPIGGVSAGGGFLDFALGDEPALLLLIAGALALLAGLTLYSMRRARSE
jgi:hypothetical protein